MQSSFCFADVEAITVPTTGFVYYFRSLRTTETIFVRKKRLNPASVLKNNPKIDTAIKLTNTRFNTSSKSFTLKAQKRQDNNDIFPLFLRKSWHFGRIGLRPVFSSTSFFPQCPLRMELIWFFPVLKDETMPKPATRNTSWCFFTNMGMRVLVNI